MLLSVTGPDAVILTKAGVVTAVVVTGKVAWVFPPATVTLAWTDAAEGVSLVKLKDVPAAGAGALNVIVPVELPVIAAPPTTCCELRASEFTPRP